MKHGTADTVLTIAAVLFMLIGLIALAIVVASGLRGASPSSPLTLVGLSFPVVAFVLMLVEFVRMIIKKRAS